MCPSDGSYYRSFSSWSTIQVFGDRSRPSLTTGRNNFKWLNWTCPELKKILLILATVPDPPPPSADPSNPSTVVQIIVQLNNGRVVVFNLHPDFCKGKLNNNCITSCLYKQAIPAKQKTSPRKSILWNWTISSYSGDVFPFRLSLPSIHNGEIKGGGGRSWTDLINRDQFFNVIIWRRVWFSVIVSELISQVRHQWRNRRIWSWKHKQRDVQFAITSHIRKIHIVQGHSSLSRFTSSLIANYSLIHMQIVVHSSAKFIGNETNRCRGIKSRANLPLSTPFGAIIGDYKAWHNIVSCICICT